MEWSLDADSAIVMQRSRQGDHCDEDSGRRVGVEWIAVTVRGSGAA